jgi:prevent-host-death family protein
MDSTYSSADARNIFSELLSRAYQGERITVERNGIPLAKIVPATDGYAPVPLGHHEFSVLIHGRAVADAHFGIRVWQTKNKFYLPTASGDVTEALMSRADKRWLLEYAGTLLREVDSLAASLGLESPPVDKVLTGISMSMPNDAEHRSQLLGPLKRELSSRLGEYGRRN